MTSGIPETDGGSVHIEELELRVSIGVTEEERATPQRLQLNVTVWPTTAFRDLRDQISGGVDYTHVCASIHRVVGSRSDRLLETLAEAIASDLLERFPIRRVELELRKFVLPDAKFAAVRLNKSR